jgi:hypothetical protein
MEASSFTDQDLHDFALTAIANALGNSAEPSLMDLSGLRGSLQLLRSRYGAEQSRMGAVDISYTGDVAVAYLAAYLPAYVRLAEWSVTRVLQSSPESIGTLDQPFTIGLLGSGPCPELVALAGLLDQSRSGGSAVNAHLFDKNHAGWSRARESVLTILKRRFPSMELHITLHDIDLTDDRSPVESMEIPPLDFILGQNLLNETTSAMTPFLDNILAIAGHLRSNGRLTLADQRNSATTKGMAWLRMVSEPTWTGTRTADRLEIEEPQFVRHRQLWTLFKRQTDGLIPRKFIPFEAIELKRDR